MLYESLNPLITSTYKELTGQTQILYTYSSLAAAFFFQGHSLSLTLAKLPHLAKVSLASMSPHVPHTAWSHFSAT